MKGDVEGFRTAAAGRHGGPAHCVYEAGGPAEKSEPAARGEEHYVYRRHGKPCFLCGEKILRRDLAGRTLYWCAKDQHTSNEETATAFAEGVSLRASRELAKPGGMARKRAGQSCSSSVGCDSEVLSAGSSRRCGQLGCGCG